VKVAAPSAPDASPRSSSRAERPRQKSREKRPRMPKNDKRVKITLECTDCKRRNYITMKSKINDRERLEMKKYCSFDRKHTVHKETR
jgi:large subunit ribosomal protein L33